MSDRPVTDLVDDLRHAAEYAQPPAIRGLLERAAHEVEVLRTALDRIIEGTGKVAGVLVLLAVPALAAPPPTDSEDYQALHPYSKWIEGVQTPDKHSVCCNEADGRTVDYRTQGERYQIKFRHPESLTAPSWPGADSHPPPDGWIDVPPEAVLRIENPTGESIAWWWNGVVRCFLPASGV